MANLRTHKERMAALEEAYDHSTNAIERASIVQVAATLDREHIWAQKDELQEQAIPQMNASKGLN